jgi:hypothetical protein
MPNDKCQHRSRLRVKRGGKLRLEMFRPTAAYRTHLRFHFLLEGPLSILGASDPKRSDPAPLRTS